MHIDLCLNPKRFSKREIDKSLDRIVGILSGYPVELAYLGGSVLFKESPHFLSDLDIGILPKKEIASDFLSLYTEIYPKLCRLLGGDNIDLINFRESPLSLRLDFIRNGKLIFSSEDEKVLSFIEETLFQYYDLLPFKREERNYLYSSIKGGMKNEMRRINREKIDLYLKNLNRSVDKLKLLRRKFLDYDDFSSNEDGKALVEHFIRIALESVLDISRHVVAAKDLPLESEDNISFIDALGKGRIIPLEFARKIRGMAGMRNALVHLYWGIDYKKLYSLLRDELDDFSTFAKYILEFIERE
jgi:uncharacterized protein YutE (UPF0331/DUF86 family)